MFQLTLYTESCCTLIGMSHYTGRLWTRAWVQAGGCKQTLPRYQQG